MTVTAPPVSSHAIRTPANAVTALRIILAPVLIAVIYFYAPAWWVLVFGFVAMFTDRIDGILARRYGTSSFGAFLDPIADKLMVLGALSVLVVKGWAWWLPVALIAGREVAMSWWRSKRVAGRGPAIAPRRLAKLKTWSQSFTVAFALTPGVVDNSLWIVTSMLWLSVAMTLYTFWQYVEDSRKAST